MLNLIFIVILIGIICLFVPWLIWCLWCFIMPQIFTWLPGSFTTPNFWLFAGLWFILSLIFRSNVTVNKN